MTPFAFVDGGLDRADALRDQPEALARLWPAARVLLLDDEGRALGDAEGGAHVVEGRSLGGGPGTAVFLGMRDGQGWSRSASARSRPPSTKANGVTR